MATRIVGPIAFISDIHWGKSKDSELRLKLLDTFLHKIGEELYQMGIKNIIFLGDWYDNRNVIHVKTSHHYSYRRLRRLAERFNIYMIPGNHDFHLKAHDSEEKINSIAIFNELKNVTVFLEPEELELDGGRRAMIVPWGELPPKPEERYDYLFGHFEWKGARMVGKVLEEGYSPSDLLDYAPEVFTGHIHLRADYNYKNGVIHSIGCPLELDWGDCGDLKGVYVLDPMQKELAFVENDFSPRHIEFLYSANEKKIQDFSKANGNFVKLIVDKEHKPKRLIELIEAINNEHPLRSAFVDYIVETTGIEELIKQNSGVDLDNVQKSIVKLPPKEQVLAYIETHAEEFKAQEIDIDLLKNMAVEFFDKGSLLNVGDDDE